MNSDIRAFRRSARVWLPAWRQVRRAYYQYRKLSKDFPTPERFQRVDQYVKEVENHYASLDRSSFLLQKRERYRPDVRALCMAIEKRCPRTDDHIRDLLDTMSAALAQFEERLYLD